MAGTGQLAALIGRARTEADPRQREEAYAELTRLLTILVRSRLSAKLRERRESIDVCQSLARSFVSEIQQGKLAFDNEAALVGYLQQVVQHKIIDLSRQDQAAKRGAGAGHIPIGAGPTESGPGGGVDPGSPGPGPASLAIEMELKQAVLSRLSDEDRLLINLRQRGLEWDAIAAQVGMTSPALRKRWSRLQDSIREALADGPSA